MNQTGVMLRIDCSHCGATVRNESRFCCACGARLREPAASTEEIEFDEVNASDRILIQTQNSQYRFSILDPQNRSGKLSGGPFGDQLQDAMLMGVLIGNRADARSDTSRLKINSYALFYVNAGAGLRRLTTSLITDLILIRGDKPQRGRPR